MHAKELYIKSASFTPKDGTAVEHSTMTLDKKLMTVTLAFAEELPNGAGVLNLTFQGCLNNEMAGYYRSNYTTIAGETKVMASTQFEAIDARRAFPCWDEPARKATFVISLTVPGGLTAFSNMQETRRRTLPSGRQRVEFAETPIMSA